MERFIVSRELAEKLKAAGYPQKVAQFRWFVEPAGSGWSLIYQADDNQWTVAAPLSDELLEQTPRKFIIFKASSGMYRAGELGMNDNEELVIEPFYWEQYVERADAAARLWLWCKENGHLPLDDGGGKE